MIIVRISGNGAEQLAALSARIPQGAARAINRVLFQARRDLRAEMAKVFDRPTPYTLGSVWVSRATPDKLDGTVGFKTMAGKAPPPSRYMLPQVYGGGRPLKRFERRLGGLYAYPAESAPLDAYGNIPRGIITRIIQRVGDTAGMPATRMSEASRRRLGKAGKLSRAGRDYWIVRRGGRPIGVWGYLGPGRVGAVLRFGRAPTYRPRLDFWGVAQRTIAARLPGAIGQEMG